MTIMHCMNVSNQSGHAFANNVEWQYPHAHQTQVAWLNPDHEGLLPPATYLGAQRRYSFEFDWYCMLAAHLPGSPFRGMSVLKG